MKYIYGLDNSCDNIVIEYVNSTDKKNSMQSDHYHDFFEFYFYLGNTMTYFIDDKNYTLKKYDLVFIDKGIFHRTNYIDGKKERILIMFRKEFFDILTDTSPIENMLELFAKTPVMSFTDEIKSKLNDDIMKLTSLHGENKENMFPVQIALMQLILSVNSYIKNGFLGFTKVISDQKNTVISNITEYINTNYSSDITLDFLMNTFYIDKFHLCHSFKKITGMTVIEFINQKRLIEAKKLLKSSDYKISKICEMVGFQSQNHFNTLFKRSFKQTPTEFKNSRKE